MSNSTPTVRLGGVTSSRSSHPSHLSSRPRENKEESHTTWVEALVFLGLMVLMAGLVILMSNISNSPSPSLSSSSVSSSPSPSSPSPSSPSPSPSSSSSSLSLKKIVSSSDETVFLDISPPNSVRRRTDRPPSSSSSSSPDDNNDNERASTNTINLRNRLLATQLPNPDPKKNHHISSPRPVAWYAPFWDDSGFSEEAFTYVNELQRYDSQLPITIVQAPTPPNKALLNTLPKERRRLLTRLQNRQWDPSQAIVICHFQPSAYYPNKWYRTCPETPGRSGSRYLISRAMFETDSIPSNWPGILKTFDEVWVPTKFHVDVFTKAGVEEDKVKLIPESINTTFWDPERIKTPFPLWKAKKEEFKFLSIFKWEARKGCDILVKAFILEFGFSHDPVSLYVLTHWFSPLPKNWSKWIGELEDELGLTDKEGYRRPVIFFMVQIVTEDQMPSIYKAVDAFVLPTRGEGWGLPQSEAMAMELPVISTFWSGTTEFMTEENSYPLNIDRVEPSLEPPQEGFTKGHNWAVPSLTHLRQLLRHVSDPENRIEVREKAKRARRDIMEKYCSECVGKIVADRLLTIAEKLESEDDDSERGDNIAS